MIYEKTDNFFIQKINIDTVYSSRFDFFKSLCANKKVLHVGCADAMTFNVDNNLHIFLSKNVKQLYGLDISIVDLIKMKENCAGEYFSSYSDCKKHIFDIVIIPEVLEHTTNAKEFLDEIFSINAKEFFISVPNIIHYSKEMLQSEKSFIEIVHPDHKYWFSPYTLYNIVKPYIRHENLCKMFYLENGSMIGIHLMNNN